MTRALLLAAFLGAVSLTASAPSAFGAPEPAPAGTPAPAGDAVRGQKTFKMLCSVCHGLKAHGFIGPWIGKDNANPEDLHKIVRNGIERYGGMPRFSPVALSDKDIEDILAYLLTLPLDPN
ncbi:MAG: cytochrome c [Candidatus Velthaea sp.]